MIIEIQQLKRRDIGFQCYRDGVPTCDVASVIGLTATEYFFDFKNTGRKLRLYFNPVDKSFGKGLTERFATHIFLGDSHVGKIVGSDKKDETGVYHIEYEGQKYISYLVGNGKDGDFLCIYKEDGTLICEIRRTKYPQDSLDYYVAFCASDDLEELACLLAVHIDFYIFNNVSYEDDTYGSYKYRYGERYYKEEFVKNIANQEGFDLNKKRYTGCFPKENVQVWDENAAVKKKKRFAGMKILYILGILFFIYTIIQWFQAFIK